MYRALYYGKIETQTSYDIYIYIYIFFLLVVSNMFSRLFFSSTFQNINHLYQKKQSAVVCKPLRPKSSSRFNHLTLLISCLKLIFKFDHLRC